MAMQSPLVCFVQSRLEYLDLNAEMGRPAEALTKLSIEVFNKIIGMLQRTSSLTCEVALKIADILNNNKILSEDQKHGILTEIEKRMCFLDTSDAPAAVADILPATAVNNADSASSPNRSKMQNITILHHALTEPLWKAIMSADVAFEAAIKLAGTQMKAMGVNHPNEKSVAKAVATVAAARHKSHGANVESVTLLMAGRVLKQTIRSLPLVFDGPPVYSDGIEQLQQDHPALYQIAFPQEPPVPSKLSTQEIEIQVCMTPCRSTKRSIEEPIMNASGWNKVPRQSFGCILGAASQMSRQLTRSSSVAELALQDRAAQHAIEDRAAQLALQDRAAKRALEDHTSQLALEDRAADTSGPRIPAPAPALVDDAKAKLAELTANAQRQAVEQARKAAEAKEAEAAAAAAAAAAAVADPKAKAKATPKAKNAPKAQALKRPAAAVPAADLVLGCSKCRYSKKGCADSKKGIGCRNPAFKGKRGHP